MPAAPPALAALPARPPGRSAEPELPDGELPEDWDDRLDKLCCPTLVHVPVQLRPQLASVMTATLVGRTRGDEYASSLERGRSKLLYAVPLRKFSLRTELAKRLELWNEGDFEGLLLRAEAQLADRLEHKRRRRAGDAGRAAALRAKSWLPREPTARPCRCEKTAA